MEFKVKRDWLPIFLITSVLVFLVCCSVAFFFNTWVGIVVMSICVALLAFYLTSVIFASCKVENNKLIYRVGVFKNEIDLSEVKKVGKEHNYHPSLALGFDRVRIVIKEGKKQKVYYVSVADRDSLIDVIKKAMPVHTPKTTENKEATKKEETKPATKKITKKTTENTKKKN